MSFDRADLAFFAHLLTAHRFDFEILHQIIRVGLLRTLLRTFLGSLIHGAAHHRGEIDVFFDSNPPVASVRPSLNNASEEDVTAHRSRGQTSEYVRHHCRGCLPCLALSASGQV